MALGCCGVTALGVRLASVTRRSAGGDRLEVTIAGLRRCVTAQACKIAGTLSVHGTKWNTAGLRDGAVHVCVCGWRQLCTEIADEFPEINFSVFLSEKLNHNYTYLSNLFSEVKGTTIEHFIILHKIERVKELIVYDELNLTEIAFKLNYSSVAHLSNQFKKITGLTPTFFKKLKNYRRSPLEDM